MKENGIFFTDKQKELLQEIGQLENTASEEVKTLSCSDRISIFNEIIKKYSMLKDSKGILNTQTFCAMEDYLLECTKNNYKIKGL